MDSIVSNNERRSGFSRFFGDLANKTSQLAGRATTFIVAAAVVIIWAVTGPLFGYSDTWQLVINTGTTIVTFLMVFLIQNSQNRDTAALHLKLDELIRSSRARNVFADLEDAAEDELTAFQEEFRKLRERGLHADAAAEAAHRAVHQPQPAGEPAELPAQAHARPTSRTPRAR